MKLGISGQALSSCMNLEEILKVIKKFSIDTFEIWPENVPFSEGKDGYMGGYIDKNVDYTKMILAKYNIKPCCVTFSGGFDSNLVSEIDEYIKQFIACIEFANALGVKVINHYCSSICTDETPNLTKIQKYFSPALEVAEKYGITLALENEAHDATANPVNMLKIINHMDSKYFKTNFDATNYYHAGFEAYPYAYNVLKEHIGYAHVKNGCIYNENIHKGLDGKGSNMTGILKGNDIFYPPIKDGAVNIEGFLNSLVSDGYDTYCTLEPHTSPESVIKYYEVETKYLLSKKDIFK